MEEGMNWFGGMFTYDGMQRWQLWFDNPNKAAVILAQIAIIGLALFFSKGRKKALVGLAIFMFPSLALVYTFSRGGIIAWLVGTAIIVLGKFHERIWRGRCAIAAVGVCVVLVLSCWLGLSRRMAYGFSGRDRSVGNRLELWSAAPCMLHDAPGGWGLGRSGDAYMDWYQPLSGRERYRTLVNSHLTWMVETGWLGTVAWVAAWVALFCLGARLGNVTGRWGCLAEWIALFVAGSFSSVLESPWLWLIPSCIFFVEIGLLKRSACKWVWRSALHGLSVATFFVAVSGVFVFCLYRGSRVFKDGDVVGYGGAGVDCWILADESVLGGVHYPRVLREAAETSELVSFRMVDDASSLPENVEILAVCGGADPRGRRGTMQTIWLSPISDSEVQDGDTVVRGEFDNVIVDCEGAKVVEISGMSRYIAVWPLILSSIAREGHAL